MWFVEVPATFEALATQGRRSVVEATRHGGHRRVLVDAAAPELDPSCESYRPNEMISFAHNLALPLLDAGLPASKPHVKLLFSSVTDATLAGASILTTSMPVSVLGDPSSIGLRDGAFVVVAPQAAGGSSAIAEAAIDGLLKEAAGRLVIVINPRLGNSPALSTFEPAYLMRPLSLGYLRDQYAKKVDRVRACLLRCYPHEWSVLFELPRGVTAVDVQTADKGGQCWRYAGRFTSQPRAEQLEALLQREMTRARDEGGLWQ